MDLPLPVQFWRYLVHLAHGDLGISRITAQPVLSDLLRTFPATVELATCAIILGALGGITLAFLAVLKPGSWLDNAARLLSLIGYSVPIFWLSLLGLLLFYATLHWSAGPGRLDDIYLYSMEPRSGFVLIDSWLSGDRECSITPSATCGCRSWRWRCCRWRALPDCCGRRCWKSATRNT